MLMPVLGNIVLNLVSSYIYDVLQGAVNMHNTLSRLPVVLVVCFLLMECTLTVRLRLRSAKTSRTLYDRSSRLCVASFSLFL